MQRHAPSRALRFITYSTMALCVLLPARAQLQPQQPPSTLPATAPTPPPPPAQARAATPSSSTTQPHRAEVTYTSGQLSVAASDSSLNQILREISRQTGMKVTGGVTDERVFGTYGPATPVKVLAALLDGTGSNMLIVPNPAVPTGSLPGTKPPPFELVLTPRHGGPTPPNPSAPGFNDGADSPDESPRENSASPFRPPTTSPPGAQPNPNPTRSVPDNVTTPDSTTTDGNSQNGNGNKTPQQIYEQLLRLRQQQTAPQQTTPQQTTPQQTTPQQ